MKNILKAAAVVAAVLVLAGIPLAIMAQGGPPAPVVTDFGTLYGVILRIRDWIFSLLIIFAVIFILYAAFLYLTAAGDSEKVSKANKTLLYAAIAIAVALLSRALFPLIASLLGTGTAGFTP